MKVTIDRALFAESVAWVTKAVASRPIAPVMSNIRLTATADDQLVIVGSNHEVTHKATLACEVGDPGDVLVPGGLTRELTAALRGDTIELIHDEDKAGMMMRAGRSTYRLHTIPTDEWPTLQPFPPAVGTVDGGEFRTLVRAVKHFADDNSVIDATRGLRVEAAGGELRTVGTNRFVVSTATCPLSNPDVAFGLQVPARHFDAALAGMTGTVTVAHDGNVFGIADEQREVVFRTFDVEYADWRRAFGMAGEDFTVTADTAVLVEAVKRATIACEKEKPLWFSIAPGQLEITAGRTGNPDGAEVLDVDTDGNLDIAFAPAFLNAVLSVLDGDLVRFSFLNHQKKPVQVAAADDDTSLHIVMPRDPAKS